MTVGTYSQSILAVSVKHTIGTPKTVTIADTAALAGSMAMNARTGTQFLCKRPDGSEGYYTLDAERSTPANPIVVPVS